MAFGLHSPFVFYGELENHIACMAVLQKATLLQLVRAYISGHPVPLLVARHTPARKGEAHLVLQIRIYHAVLDSHLPALICKHTEGQEGKSHVRPAQPVHALDRADALGRRHMYAVHHVFHMDAA